tara:strand:+ start:316 stop:519 length:204 start_codon:yes stop_codon:yes gene_type:complete
MKANDDQLYDLYSKIYEVVELADYNIDDEDLRTACNAVIDELELDERFYHTKDKQPHQFDEPTYVVK